MKLRSLGLMVSVTAYPTIALAQEVKPFGIKVTAIEPGAFRTDWAARSMWESSTPISDYDDNVGARKTMIKEFANHLPGDPRKVAEAVLMVITLSEPPLLLLLGRDVLKAVRDKLAAFSASIDEWEAVTKNVNFPKRVFEEGDVASTLEELQLAPRAALFLHDLAA